jgi:hypothetical protein
LNKKAKNFLTLEENSVETAKRKGRRKRNFLKLANDCAYEDSRIICSANVSADADRRCGR